LTYEVPATAHVIALTKGVTGTPITVSQLAQLVSGENAFPRPLFEPITPGFWLAGNIHTVRSLDQQYHAYGASLRGVRPPPPPAPPRGSRRRRRLRRRRRRRRRHRRPLPRPHADGGPPGNRPRFAGGGEDRGPVCERNLPERLQGRGRDHGHEPDLLADQPVRRRVADTEGAGLGLRLRRERPHRHEPARRRRRPVRLREVLERQDV